MAVLHLREASDHLGTGQTARQDIAALRLQEIETFAGADWPQALRIAALPLDKPPEDAGSSCVVQLADAPGPVTFVAATGLHNALFKGPDGRRKRFVAVSARVDAAPRLAAQLRGASQQAARLTARAPKGDLDEFLAVLAQCSFGPRTAAHAR